MYDLKLGFTCNNNCVHCVVTDKRAILKNDLTTDEIKEILINKVKPIDDNVVFTGGEPTIRSDFIELVKFANANNINVHIQTNGTGFASEELTKELAPYIASVLIAIHSYDEKTHNRVVQDSKQIMYKKTLQGIKNIYKYHIPFETQTVISSINFPTLYDTYKFIQENFPGTLMHVTYPHPLGNAYKNHYIVCLKYSYMQSELYRIFKDFGKYLITEAIPLCYIYPYEKGINYIVDSHLITDFYTEKRHGLDPSNSSLKSTLIDEFGYSNNYNINDLTSKRKGSKCKECAFFNICPGVWKEYIEFYRNELDLYPIKIQFKIGSPVLILKDGYCENICIFCDGSKVGEQPLSFDEIKKRIDYFKSQGYKEIELSGEPPQHKYIINTIEYLTNNGFEYIQMSTNGRKLANKQFVKNLKNAGLTHCRIPLYGSTKDIHSKIVKSRIEGNPFKEACKAISNCAEEGIQICAHTVLTKYNQFNIKKIIDLYYKLTNGNIKEFVVQNVAISELSYDYTGQWYLPAFESKYALKDLLDDSAYDNYPIKIIGFPYCILGRYDDRIIGIYEAPQIGIQDTVGINASLSNPKVPHYNERIRLNICKDCILANECDGVLKNDNALFGSQGLKPITTL